VFSSVDDSYEIVTGDEFMLWPSTYCNIPQFSEALWIIDSSCVYDVRRIHEGLEIFGFELLELVPVGHDDGARDYLVNGLWERKYRTLM